MCWELLTLPFDKKMLNHKNFNNYEYIPDITPFMNNTGVKMDLLDILNENLPPSKTNIPSMDFLYYSPNDINGING